MFTNNKSGNKRKYKKLKELLLISDKGGTGRSTVLKSLQEIYSKEAIFADCSFSINYNKCSIISEEFFKDGEMAYVNNDNCLFCGDCEQICGFNALKYNSSGIVIDFQICTGCSSCVYICPTGAITLNKINAGKIFVARNNQDAIFVYGAIQHFSHNGIRPVLKIRNKAFQSAVELNKSIIFIEALPGWNRLTHSLLYYSNILVPIVEPHQFVFEFLEKIKAYSTTNKLEVKLIINKSDVNFDVTSKIIKKYNSWKIICIPWNDKLNTEINNFFINFI